MSRIRLYVDEDAIERGFVAGLRSHGVDVLSASEASLVGADDETQLIFASSRARTLYTFNIGDFARLHEEWLRRAKSHAGIVFGAQQRFGVGEQLRRVLHLITRIPAAEMENRVEYITRWRAD
jgi:hypothetical protein